MRITGTPHDRKSAKKAGASCAINQATIAMTTPDMMPIATLRNDEERLCIDHDPFGECYCPGQEAHCSHFWRIE
jgi:hypothetical protein